MQITMFDIISEGILFADVKHNINYQNYQTARGGHMKDEDKTDDINK